MNNTPTCYCYLNSEVGGEYAQIVVWAGEGAPPESVGLEQIHHREWRMGFEMRVHLNKAGELYRKSKCHPQHLYFHRHPKYIPMVWVEPLMSVRRTPSGDCCRHIFCGRNRMLAYVQLEGPEVQEVWDRINAVSYDERSAVLADYAHELTNGNVGRALPKEEKS